MQKLSRKEHIVAESLKSIFMIFVFFSLQISSADKENNINIYFDTDSQCFPRIYASI